MLIPHGSNPTHTLQGDRPPETLFLIGPVVSNHLSSRQIHAAAFLALATCKAALGQTLETLTACKGRCFIPKKVRYFLSNKIDGALCFRVQALAFVPEVILVQREWDAARLFGIV